MKVGLIIPFRERCGINDYARLLKAAFPGEMDLLPGLDFDCDEYDLVHVQYEPTLFRTGRRNPLPAFLKACTVPVVATVHEVYETNPFIAPPPQGSGLVFQAKKIAYRYRHRLELSEEAFERARFHAQEIIVHTAHARAILVGRGCAEEKITILPHPVFGTNSGDRDAGRARWGNGDAPLVLHFGFITGVNDYETLLRAVSLAHAPVRLVLAGGIRREADETIDREIDSAIERLGIGERVVRPGYVRDGDLADLFAAADLFISTAKFKTSSGAVARALGAHVPVIATNLPFIQEINQESGCVKTYDAGDAQALAAAIEKKTNRMYRDLAARYAALHSLTSFALRHIEIYGRTSENHY